MLIQTSISAVTRLFTSLPCIMVLPSLTIATPLGNVIILPVLFSPQIVDYTVRRNSIGHPQGLLQFHYTL